MERSQTKVCVSFCFCVSRQPASPQPVFMNSEKRKDVNCGKGCKISTGLSPSCSYDVMGRGEMQIFGVIYALGSSGRGLSDVNIDKGGTLPFGLSV